MSPPVELILRFDGTAHGLPDHALSISAFKASLPLLLTAVQKTIDIVTGTPEYEAEHRKSSVTARAFDLQIVSVGEGSLVLTLGLVFVGGTELPKVPGGDYKDVAVRAVQKFTEDVQDEWAHRGSRESVRKYMKALPKGITEQGYSAVVDGTVLKSVKLSGRDKHEAEGRPVPRTSEVRGLVKGLTFDQANGRVRIKDAAGTVHVCLASQQVVEMAVKLHKFMVIGTILVNKDQKRLINIRDDGDSRSTLSQEERTAFLCDQWHEALKRLAE